MGLRRQSAHAYITILRHTILDPLTLIPLIVIPHADWKKIRFLGLWSRSSLTVKNIRIIILYLVPISLWPTPSKENRYFYTRHPNTNDRSGRGGRLAHTHGIYTSFYQPKKIEGKSILRREGTRNKCAEE